VRQRGPLKRKKRAAQAACIALSIVVDGCAAEQPERADLAIAATSQALTPAQPGRRPTIHDFGPADRTALANAILAFITQPVLTEHANGHDWHHPAVGELFFVRHHDYLNQLENYLRSNGLSRFVPVPEWNPGTSIPAEFMVADPLVSPAPMTQTPNRPVPAQFSDSRLCTFSSASALAQSVELWHDGVHGAVGGAMAFLSDAPGAPIFWLWHGLLDDMYHERTWRCETLPALIVTALRT
jgi:hypothetical protein